jgi:hypothetical protein
MRFKIQRTSDNEEDVSNKRRGRWSQTKSDKTVDLLQGKDVSKNDAWKMILLSDLFPKVQ